MFREDISEILFLYRVCCDNKISYLFTLICRTSIQLCPHARPTMIELRIDSYEPRLDTWMKVSVYNAAVVCVSLNELQEQPRVDYRTKSGFKQSVTVITVDMRKPGALDEPLT